MPTADAHCRCPVSLQAPEILSQQPASPASDVYSFGLVLWELLTWRLPWSGTFPFGVRAHCGGRLRGHWHAASTGSD